MRGRHYPEQIRGARHEGRTKACTGQRQLEATLEVTVTEGTINKENNGRDIQLLNRRLLISREVRDDGYEQIFSSDTMDNFLSAFVLGDNGSNLFTTWITGSAYRFVVYSYQDGKIKQVLDVGSRIMPEIIRLHDGGHAIIVSNVDWTKDNTGKSKQTPISADIYEWDGAAYKLDKTVPWDDRLSVVQ